MKRIFLLFAAMTVIFSASAQDFGVQNYVQANGTGEVEVKPNEFTLAITIDENATKGRYTIDDVESKMRRALKKLKISDKVLTMSSMMGQKEKRKDSKMRADYELILNSVSQIEGCYDEFKDLDITQVKIVEVTHTDIEKYKDEARAKAVADAMSRAKKIGEALGQSVEECFQISDNSFYVENSRPNLMMRSAYNSDAAVESAAMRSDIEFRSININYSVKAKFVLAVSAETRRAIVQ